MTARAEAWVAAALVLVLALHVALMLPRAELWQYDEYYTAERTLGIVTSGDWGTIRSNGVPSFRKPPLQYWTGAALIRAGVPEGLALRALPFLSALGVMALTGWLARRLSAGRPGAVLAALLMLTGSTLFWVSASSAMLDMPAALSVLAALCLALAARQRPRLWWAVALVVGAGALQKAPVAALAVLPVLALPGVPAGRHGRGALVLALVLIAVWPVAQWLLHGAEALRIGVLQEGARRFLPGLQDDLSRQLRWPGWMAADGAVLWAGLLGLTALLPWLQRNRLTALPAALAGGFILILTLAGGETFDRYLLLILPILAAAAGAALAHLPRGAVLAPAFALGLSLTADGPWKDAAALGLDRPGMAPFRPLLAGFRAALVPGEAAIVCGWGKSDLIIFPGALSLLASDGRPFRRIWTPEDITPALAARAPLRGLCLEGEFAALSARFPALRVVDRQAGWVHWATPAAAP